MKASLYFLLAFLLLNFSSYSQSTTGTRGLVKAPTARMFEDGALSIGAAFIPPGYFKNTYGWQKGKLTGNAGLNTFVTVNLFPFMEVMFRYTHTFNYKVTPQTRYFPDRMFSARVRLIKENKKFPAIVIGMQDVAGFFDRQASNTQSEPNFSSFYLVGSKKLELNSFTLDFSLGFGTRIEEFYAREFKGLFGGVEITSPYLENTQLLLDYDATYINIGVQKQFFNRLQAMVSYYPNYQKIGWVLAYRYKIY